MKDYVDSPGEEYHNRVAQREQNYETRDYPGWRSQRFQEIFPKYVDDLHKHPSKNRVARHDLENVAAFKVVDLASEKAGVRRIVGRGNGITSFVERCDLRNQAVSALRNGLQEPWMGRFVAQSVTNLADVMCQRLVGTNIIAPDLVEQFTALDGDPLVPGKTHKNVHRPWPDVVPGSIRRRYLAAVWFDAPVGQSESLD